MLALAFKFSEYGVRFYAPFEGKKLALICGAASNRRTIMLTKTKIVVASTLILGSASVANAEDPEANVYHLRAPRAASYSRQYVLPYASTLNQQMYWRKRSNSA